MTYHTSSYPNVIREERSYNVVYLDNTYLRQKSTTLTNERFYEDGTSTTSTTFTVNEYDGKKPIGSQTYVNGTLSSVCRDYQYDGLTCYYFYTYISGIEKKVAKSRADNNRPRRRLKQSCGLFY